MWLPLDKVIQKSDVESFAFVTNASYNKYNTSGLRFQRTYHKPPITRKQNFQIIHSQHAKQPFTGAACGVSVCLTYKIDMA